MNKQVNCDTFIVSCACSYTIACQFGFYYFVVLFFMFHFATSISNQSLALTNPMESLYCVSWPSCYADCAALIFSFGANEVQRVM